MKDRPRKMAKKQGGFWDNFASQVYQRAQLASDGETGSSVGSGSSRSSPDCTNLQYSDPAYIKFCKENQNPHLTILSTIPGFWQDPTNSPLPQFLYQSSAEIDVCDGKLTEINTQRLTETLTPQYVKEIRPLLRHCCRKAAEPFYYTQLLAPTSLLPSESLQYPTGESSSTLYSSSSTETLAPQEAPLNYSKTGPFHIPKGLKRPHPDDETPADGNSSTSTGSSSTSTGSWSTSAVNTTTSPDRESNPAENSSSTSSDTSDDESNSEEPNPFRNSDLRIPIIAKKRFKRLYNRRYQPSHICDDDLYNVVEEPDRELNDEELRTWNIAMTENHRKTVFAENQKAIVDIVKRSYAEVGSPIPTLPTNTLIMDKKPSSPLFARALASSVARRPRGEKKPIPETQKDDKYFERRKRNNLAAKKSRDNRKQREDQIALRACLLERENAILRLQLAILREKHGLRPSPYPLDLGL